MEYFEILNLQREPFSNSPDPDFFFQSRQHLDCLQKLEIALRLRRGLNVVVGDVGTGKTTLCRQLIRRFSADKGVETHLILDPHFSSPFHFLTTVAGMFHGNETIAGQLDEGAVKELIKSYLFRKGVEEDKTVVLIIDEGQKIPTFCLELLREFLNYETNEYKLLQIVIFAQKEFETVVHRHSNFTDRINLYHTLNPLGFGDTIRMIRFRIRQSGDKRSGRSVFSLSGFWAIYLSTGGYPRKIINLCHRSILTMIIQNRSSAGWFLIRSCVKRAFPNDKPKRRLALTVGFAAVVVIVAGLLSRSPSIWSQFFPAPVGVGMEKKTALKNVPAINQPMPDSQEPLLNSVAAILPPSVEPVAVAAPGLDTLKPIEEAGYSVPAAAEKKEIVGNPLALPESPPNFLGKIALRKGESLWQMVQHIYGVFNSRYLEEILDVNPHIRNPDDIAAGIPINFPVVQVEIKPTKYKCWWVKLDDKPKLEQAIDMIRSYPDSMPPIRIIPQWRPDRGLHFAIVLREYRFEKSGAQALRKMLPRDLALKGQVVTFWGDQQTIFFANPFLPLSAHYLEWNRGIASARNSCMSTDTITFRLWYES